MNLNDLPVLIDEPGNYKTRNGKMVSIHEIRKGTSTFEAKGSIWKHVNKMGVNPTFGVWHVSGRSSTFGETNLDILKKEEK
jgi:hypothetical protein